MIKYILRKEGSRILELREFAREFFQDEYDESDFTKEGLTASWGAFDKWDYLLEKVVVAFKVKYKLELTRKEEEFWRYETEEDPIMRSTGPLDLDRFKCEFVCSFEEGIYLGSRPITEVESLYIVHA
jgi:hypothetical protein